MRSRTSPFPIVYPITSSRFYICFTLVSDMCASISDLSAPAPADAELRTSLDTLEALFGQLPAAIVVSDENGHIVRVNAQVEKIFGYAGGELVGQVVELLIPERFRPLYVDRRQQYLQDPERRAMGAGMELYGRHKSGKEFPIDAVLSAVETPEGKRILSLIRDFTERDPAGGFRLHLAELVDSSSEAIIGRTLDGIICSWNRSAERIFRYSAAEAIGQPIGMLYPPGSEDEELDMERLKRGETIDAHDAVRRRKDGQNIDVSVSVSPIFDPQGNLIGASKVARDITERKQLEAELEASREQAMISARLSELGMMAGSVAHEINNPLSVIHASASDLLEMAEIGSVPIEELQIASSRIKRTADRISKIIKSLRQIARKGNNDPLQRASAVEIVEQVLDLSRERFRVNSVRLDTTVDKDVFVLCREVQIAQVLLNLLLNAFDAAVEGAGQKWVRVEVAGHEETVMFAVIDSGPGVPDELKTRIMEPFYTTKPVGKGTGLGLSLSKAFIEEHGGELVLSERENHTCFSFVLPLFKEPEDATQGRNNISGG
jgi:PAS domain S-box-containing protein